MSAFTASEVALACVLLVAAALLVRSFAALQRADMGFQSERLLAAGIVLPESRYSEPPIQTQALRRMLEAIEGLPGIDRAAFVIGFPLAGFGEIGHSLVFDDRPRPDPSEQPSARSRPVIGDYFRTMGIPVVEGRGFTERDDENAPLVAVVNQSFARHFWPEKSPIGRRVAWQWREGEPRWMSVIGVVRDVKSGSLVEGDEEAVYTPYLQRDQPWLRFGHLVARTRVEPSTLTQALREAVWTVDPNVPVEGVTTMDRLVSGSMAQQRFNTLALGVFGAVALTIALQGIYGVLSYALSQRRNEVGIRMVMGAGPRDVLASVLGEGVRLVTAGLVIGLLAAFALTRWLGSLLYGIGPVDLVSYVAAALLVGATAVATAYLPARRATRIDPIQALRYE